jgi:hypothetical protein
MESVDDIAVEWFVLVRNTRPHATLALAPRLGPALTDQGLASLAQLRCGMVALDLRRCACVTDYGLAHLAPLLARGLRVVALPANGRVTRAGVLALMHAARCRAVPLKVFAM